MFSDQNGKTRTLDTSVNDGFWKTMAADYQAWGQDLENIKY